MSDKHVVSDMRYLYIAFAHSSIPKGKDMTSMKEAQLGIEQAQKEQLVQKLNSVYCEREALENQIRACQWNTQGGRSSEFNQILSAASPDSHSFQRSSQSRTQQTIQPFWPSNEVAERISMLGARLESTYHGMSEFSGIESPPSSTDVHQNAEYLTKELYKNNFPTDSSSVMSNTQ